MRIGSNNPSSLTILHGAFWRTGSSMSGGDQILYQVFSRLASDFSSITIFTSSDGEAWLKTGLAEASYVVFPSWFERFGLFGAYILRTFASLPRLLKLSTDFIFSSSDFFPDVLPAFLYKLFHPDVIWIAPVYHLYPHWKKRPGSKVRAFVGYYLQCFSLRLMRHADVVLCINTLIPAKLALLKIPPRKIHVIYPGINSERIRAYPKATSGYDAVFLGRLSPSKGIFDLPEIWKLVHEALPNARLGIVGGGSETVRDALKKAFDAYGLVSSMDLLGYLADPVAFGLLKASRVFVFPSHEEGFGIAPLEAQTCGLPVVAWDLPVFSEVFPTGMLRVPLGDIPGFAQAIVRLIEDSQLHSQVASGSVQNCERFSWDNMADAVGKLFI